MRIRFSCVNHGRVLRQNDQFQQEQLIDLEIQDESLLYYKDLYALIEGGNAEPKDMSNAEWKKLGRKVVEHNCQ